MNPAQLLAHFDRISDSPDAMPRLRLFILDLAVRGKLVEQDPRDEPASELLKRIEDNLRERKARGESTEPRNAIDVAVDSLPFSVPPSWRWTRLIEIADVSYGFAFESSRFNSNKVGMPLIRIRDISGTETQAYYEGGHDPAYVVSKGDYLVGMDGDFNVRKWKGPDALLNQRVMRIKNWRAALVAEFLAIPLQMILDYLHASTSQTTVKHLSAKQVNGIYLPIPPLAEQHRIVAKVDELMALCDRLEAAQAERESWRDRLVASSLHRLNNGVDHDSFRSYARFYFNHLPRLTTKSEHIQQLRQTILNLAVRGKLVPQDPDDEPASELFNRSGATKSNKQPFSIPISWVWVSVGQIGDSRLGKMLDKGKNKGIPRRYLRNVNVRWFDFNLSDVFQMRFEDAELDEFALHKGDVLICEGGEPGRAAVWDERESDIYFQKAIHRVRFSKGVSPHYFANVLRESADSGRLATYFTGVGIKHFTGKGLASFLFPLPPLAEQQRIVAKVDELMALCNQIEAQLTTTHADSSRLLEAVLHEALAMAV